MIIALTHAGINVNLPILIVFLFATIGLLKLQETKNKQASVNN